MNHTINARSLLCWKDCSQRNKEKRCIKRGEIIKGILCLFAALLFVASCGGGGGGGNSSIPNNDSVMDADGDGIADAMDNCPSISNPDQRDDDQDGIGDTCDALIDSDGDGIADAADNCPSISNPDQRDDDQDGIGRACDTSDNLPPTADAGPDQTVDERTEVLLSGSGTDPNGTISSYSWVQTEGRTVVLSGAGTQNANFTSPYVEQKETLVFQLTVTDDEGARATDTIEITVNNSDPLKPTPLREPKFVFGDQLSEEDKQNFKEDAYLAMRYIRDETDIVLNMDLTYYAFLDRENFIAAYLEFHEMDFQVPVASGFGGEAGVRERLQEIKDTYGYEEWGTFEGPAVFIYGERFIYERPYRLQVIAHEHFHAIQTLGEVGSDGIRHIGPEWLMEGSARYVEGLTLEHAGLWDLSAAIAARMARARKFTRSLQSLETTEAFFALPSVSDGYTLGALAAGFLADNYGGLHALTRYYRSIEPGTTWEEAFENTFGISINEFYREFGQYRSENFPPSPTPSVEQHQSEGSPPLHY